MSFAQVVAEGAAADGEDRGTLDSLGDGEAGDDLRVNGAGLPMRTEITPGQDSDYTGYDLVMADNLPQPVTSVKVV